MAAETCSWGRHLARLDLSAKASKFGLKEAKCLGHLIGAARLGPLPHRAKAIGQMPRERAANNCPLALEPKARRTPSKGSTTPFATTTLLRCSDRDRPFSSHANADRDLADAKISLAHHNDLRTRGLRE